jgi:hypothetical protein
LWSFRQVVRAAGFALKNVVNGVVNLNVTKAEFVAMKEMPLSQWADRKQSSEVTNGRSMRVSPLKQYWKMKNNSAGIGGESHEKRFDHLSAALACSLDDMNKMLVDASGDAKTSSLLTNIGDELTSVMESMLLDDRAR